jgi:hypothetical protein
MNILIEKILQIEYTIVTLLVLVVIALGTTGAIGALEVLFYKCVCGR